MVPLQPYCRRVLPFLDGFPRQVNKILSYATATPASLMSLREVFFPSLTYLWLAGQTPWLFVSVLQVSFSRHPLHFPMLAIAISNDPL